MGRLNRVEDWPLRLNEAIDAARDKPFEWGKHDCATWAAEIVQAVTGKAIKLPRFDAYGSASEASDVLKRLGFEYLSDAVSTVLEPIDTPLLAQRGDIVQHRVGALGVCVGSDAFCLGTKGLFAVPLKSCIHAWRV